MDALVCISLSHPHFRANTFVNSQEQKRGMLSAVPSQTFAYVPVASFSDETSVLKVANSVKTNGPAESKTVKKQKEWIKTNVPHLE